MKHFLRRNQWQEILIGLLIVATFIGSQISPYFLNYLNLANSAITFVPIALMVLGLFPVIVLGEMDISLASILAVCAVTYAKLWQSGYPVGIGIIVTVILAAILGLVNGLLVAVVGLPSMAVTLGTFGAYRGVAYLLAGDAGINGVSGDYTSLGASWVGYIPVAVIVFVVAAIVFWILMAKTNFGLYCYAAGNQSEAVNSAGISVKLLKIAAYILAAVAACLAGIVWVGQYASARGDNADGTIMLVITAVVLGGVSIFGGSGRTSGVVLSIILLFVVQSAMSLANVPGTTQTLISGLILIVAIIIPNLSEIKLLVRKRLRAHA